MAEQPLVLIVGDACPDLVLTGDIVPRFGQAEQLLDKADLVIGGSGTIMACGLARLGVPVAVAAVVGDDVYGDFMRASLESAGVDTRWLRTDPQTPTGLSVILSGQADRAILTLPGTMGTTDPTVLPAYDELAGVRVVHSASMFLLPGLAPALPAWLRGLDDNVTVSLDTNWDPRESWAGARDVLGRADLFLPNAAELRAITAIDDLEQAGRTLASAGTTVALKNGADGGIVWTPDGSRFTAPGVPVDVVDTTGAGDSFDAGYLRGLLDGLDAQECLRVATAAGSLSTRRRGGTGAQPDIDELRSALVGAERSQLTTPDQESNHS